MKTKTIFLSLLTALGAACGDDVSQTTVSLQFALTDGDTEIGCDDLLAGVGADAVDLEVRDARFYVSNVRLVSASGEVPVALDDVSPFQISDVALVDFESACSDAGDTNTNDVVVGTVPEGEYTGVRFTVGVPFELNHIDQVVDETTTTPEPLRATGMWWNWQGGFKFIRVDLAPTPDSTSPGFNIHLGSTACMGNPLMGEDVTSCGNPNRMEVELTGFDPASDTIAFDLRAALDGALTNQNTGAALGCQSFPMDEECPAVFDNLGLPYGGVAPSGPQSVFRVR